MDATDYIEKGQALLKTGNAQSVIQAIELFKKANSLTSNDSFEKPITLYSLAYGCLSIANYQQAYMLVKKAYQLCASAKSYGPFNMEHHPYESEITDMIKYLESKNLNLRYDESLFDENTIDYSMVSKMYNS
jgi:hypothetical protein